MKHVLIAEDLEESHYLLQALLQKKGFRVTGTSDGLQALAAARRQPPDIIISDALMPHLDGFSLCRSWMQDQVLKHIPFIFYSATYTSPDDKKLGRALGAARYLTKPMLPADLLHEIDTVLKEKAGGRGTAPALPLDEAAFLALHDAVLARKLEDKLTQLRDLNRKLHESEQNYRQLFEANPQPMWVYDLRTLLFLAVNDAAIDHYGYSRDEFLSMVFTDLIPLESEPSLLLDFTQETNHPLHKTRVWQHRRKDDSLIDVELSAHALDFQGYRARMVLVNDVTERKLHEAELRRLNNELEQRIGARTHALQVANQELEAFSYSVSHDLRTPLRAINGFSRIIEEEYATQLGEKGRELFGRVRSGTEKMGHLIDNLIQLSQISRQTMHVKRVDLSALAKEVSSELRSAEPARQVEWVIAPGVEAKGDEGLLKAVLGNLFGNAWKYTSRRAVAHIEFGVTQSLGGRPEYFVRDNGVGFDMSYVDKLFGAFQRLHSPQEFPGTGIGLATVARIIHRHGGDVRAEGEVGAGACFYFTL